MDVVRIALLVLLAAILVSLGKALYHLASGSGDSAKTARALTVRIALSLALFIALMMAWYFGVIHPHSGP